MRVLFHYAAGPELRRRLAALSAQGLDVDVCPEPDDELLYELIGQIDVLWHVLRPATRELIDAGGRLRLIQKIGVGVNTIDLDAARDRGIAVCNLPGTNSRAVAELTLMLMLSVLRQLGTYDRAIRRGDGWSLDPQIQDQLGELGGRTVGLVGYGAVGRQLAPMLKAMGARVLYTARSRKDEADADWRELDELLSEADIVSLHLPQTEQTECLLDKQALGRMKSGAILINTARGGLVDEEALIAALEAGRLGGAGLDVFATEPLDHASRLCQLENVVLTPHVAWLTVETFDRSFELAAENCRRLASGEPLLYRVV